MISVLPLSDVQSQSDSDRAVTLQEQTSLPEKRPPPPQRQVEGAWLSYWQGHSPFSILSTLSFASFRKGFLFVKLLWEVQRPLVNLDKAGGLLGFVKELFPALWYNLGDHGSKEIAL